MLGFSWDRNGIYLCNFTGDIKTGSCQFILERISITSNLNLRLHSYAHVRVSPMELT